MMSFHMALSFTKAITCIVTLHIVTGKYLIAAHPHASDRPCHLVQGLAEVEREYKTPQYGACKQHIEPISVPCKPL